MMSTSLLFMETTVHVKDINYHITCVVQNNLSPLIAIRSFGKGHFYCIFFSDENGYLNFTAVLYPQIVT